MKNDYTVKETKRKLEASTRVSYILLGSISTFVCTMLAIGSIVTIRDGIVGEEDGVEVIVTEK